MHLDAALVSAACGAVGGLLVPTLIARVPEPEPRPVPERTPEADATLEPEPEPEP